MSVMNNANLLRLAGLAAAMFLASCAAKPPPEPVAPVEEKPAPVEVIPEATKPRFNNKIGLMFPIDAANPNLMDRGVEMDNAARLAVELLGLNDVFLTTYNTGGAPELARLAAERAIADGNGAIIGPLTSANTEAVAPLMAREAIPMIALTNDSDRAQPNIYVFGRTVENDIAELFDYLERNELRRVGILAPQNLYGDRAVAQAEAQAGRHGLAITNIFRFSGDSSEVVAQMQQFADSMRRESFGPAPDFDALLVPASAFTMQTVLPGLIYAEMPIKDIRLVGLGIWADPNILTDQMMQGAFFPDVDNNRREAFRQAYVARYNSEPTRIADLAFDAAALLGTLITQQNLQGNAPPTTEADLLNPEGFAGITGLFRLEEDGKVTRKLGMTEVKNGAFVPLEATEESF